ncbi:MAG TPA: hypothetical protein VE987_14365 [Polyangiaceae bacterium]|nr:hypothetical protein [Polyangiaceae bacterium]
MGLSLDPQRAAVHRLADSIWWGPQDDRLQIATLYRRTRARDWTVALLGLAAAAIVLFHGC